MSSFSSWGLRRLVLVVGDMVCLLTAIPIMLAIRTGRPPTEAGLELHLIPFAALAAVSACVFFSAGLYDRATALVSRELPGTILGAEIVNVIIAALVFLFIPIFGIAPKTNLLIYLAVSVILVSIWRVTVPRTASWSKPKKVFVVGHGADVDELVAASRSGLCPFEVVAVTSLGEVPSEGTMVDFTHLYERVFRKVPLGEVLSREFLAGHAAERALYRVAKRAFDLVMCVPLSLILLVLAPFVILAMRFEGPGPIFIRQERMGKNGTLMHVLKFRTMTRSDAGAWKGESDNQVTRVGAFLRQTSIDELPQILAVMAGTLSFIGPRSDIAALGHRLAEAIPAYLLRYTVTPGISGWAQVNQKYAPGMISPQSIEESRMRLAYDLYYVKHYSPFLDVSIA